MEDYSQQAQSLKPYWVKAVGLKIQTNVSQNLRLGRIYQAFFVILTEIKMCLLK